MRVVRDDRKGDTYSELLRERLCSIDGNMTKKSDDLSA